MNLSAAAIKSKFKRALQFFNPHNHKFLSLLIILVGIFICSVSIIGTVQRVSFEREQAVSNRMMFNSNVAVAVEQQLLSILQGANQVASFASYIYLNSSLQEVDGWLAENIIYKNMVDSIVVIDDSNHSHVLTANHDHINVQNYLNMPFYKQLQANNNNTLYMRRPVFDAGSEKWLLPIFKRFNDFSGDFAGSVMLVMDARQLVGFFKNITMDTGFILEISGTDGYARSRVSGKNFALEQGSDNLSWLIRDQGSELGSYVDEGNGFDGVKRINTFRKVEGYDLIVTFGTSYQNAIAAALQRQHKYIILVSIFNLLILSCVGIFIYIFNKQAINAKATKANEILFRETFEHAAMGIARVSLEGLILETNTKFRHLLGYGKNELESTSFYDLFSLSDREYANKIINQHLMDHHDNAPREVERIYIDRNGARVWVYEAISVVRKPNGNPDFFIIAIQDITAHKNLEKELTYNASHDLLTGLPNRSLLTKKLVRAMLKAEQRKNIVAVLFLDLNGFKSVNDTYGHAIGDELLKRVAKRMSNTVRSSTDDTVARFGGDEFSIILSNLDHINECEYIANKIFNVVKQPFAFDGGVFVNISTSIGIAVYPRDSMDADELISFADAAMYYAKRNNIGCFFWHNQDMSQQFEKVASDL